MCLSDQAVAGVVSLSLHAVPVDPNLSCQKSPRARYVGIEKSKAMTLADIVTLRVVETEYAGVENVSTCTAGATEIFAVPVTVREGTLNVRTCTAGAIDTVVVIATEGIENVAL